MVESISLSDLPRSSNAEVHHDVQSPPEADGITQQFHRAPEQDRIPIGPGENHVVTRFVQNPLKLFKPEQLVIEVDKFLRANPELEPDRRDIQHGAQIARNPYAPQAIEDLSPEDRQALVNEITHPYRYPFRFWLTIAACCCAGALQGWSQVGIVPGNEAWPEEFGIHPDTTKGSWIIGVTNSACYFSASLLGVVLTDPLNERFGRKGTLFFAAVVNFASAFGAAGSSKWWHVLICRALTGIAMGTKATTSPILASELSPASTRGSVVMSAWQICVAGGILLGFSANLAFQGLGKRAWRFQIGSCFVLSLPLFLIITRFCAESPRYLIKKGRYREAFDVLCTIRNRRLQAARDFYAIAVQVGIERNHFQSSGSGGTMYMKRFMQLFSQRRNASAVWASSVIMLGQQLCGINIIIFFGITLFLDSNYSLTQSLWISWGIGFVNMVFGFPGVYYCDRIGRRRLLLWLYPVMALFMLAAALSYHIPTESSAKIIVISLFVYLYVAAYSPGQGPCAFLYSSESMPVTHREVGMGFCVAVNFFWAGMLAALFPIMNRNLHPSRTLGTFAGLNICAMILVFFFCPETKLWTLEELDGVFDKTAMEFMRHRARYLKNLFRFYVLRDTKVEFEDLYEELPEPARPYYGATAT